MADSSEVTIDLDLDGKLLQLQVYSHQKTRTAVIKEFVANAAMKGIELKLAKGTKFSAVQLKQNDKLTDKWLVSLSIASHEVGEGKSKHYDFDGSDVFYEWLRGEARASKRSHARKQKVWLVYDECSSTRGDVLYPLVKDIEREFRVLAIKLGLPLSDTVRNRGTGEHLICNVETSELFGVLFMRPASQSYYLKELTAAETDEQREQARHLTIADEVGFGEFKNFLVKLHTVRNPVMHGQYITEQDFLSSYETLRKIKRKLEEKELFERLARNSEFMKNISDMLKSFESVTAIVQETLIPTIKNMNLFAESIKPIVNNAQLFASQTSALSQAVANISSIIPKVSPIVIPKLIFPVVDLSYLPTGGFRKSTKIVIKRAYEKADTNDGYRVLIDRLWPRGMKKEVLELDEWCKEVAPSTELRKWFAHDPTKFDEFTVKYMEELQQSNASMQLLERVRGHDTLTLVYAAKDPKANHAVVLCRYLESMIHDGSPALE